MGMRQLTYEDRPRLTVIVVSRNSAQFLRETLDSIEGQSLNSFECLFIDGASTDETAEILQEYPWISWQSEPDFGYHDALLKGLARARGDYVTQCCVSDGYLATSWFQTAVDALDLSRDCDLVWGYPRYMTEDGVLGRVSYPHLARIRNLDREQLFYHYLATGFHLPEGNYVVRRQTLVSLIRSEPGHPNSDLDFETWLEFEGNFHHNGHMSIRYQGVVNFGRQHEGSITRQALESNRRHSERFKQRRLDFIAMQHRVLGWSWSGLVFRARIAEAKLRHFRARVAERIFSPRQEILQTYPECRS